MLIFASGSCRVLSPIYHIKDVEIIHGIRNGYYGEDSAGYLFNIKQHIQFLKFIKNETELPDHIKRCFLTTYSPKYLPQNINLTLNRQQIFLDRSREQITRCKIFIFEICSLKIYEVIHENIVYQTSLFSDTAISYKQTSDDFIKDLNTLINMCPSDSLIILQTHIRPHILNKNNPFIEQRNTIYNLLLNNLHLFPNVVMLDPATLFTKDINFPLSFVKDDFIYFTSDGNDRIAHELETIIQSRYF